MFIYNHINPSKHIAQQKLQREQMTVISETLTGDIYFLSSLH